MYLVNVGHNRSVKQTLRRRIAPVVVLAGEFDVGQMASDAGHSNRAWAPWLPEIEIEGIIFDVLAPCVVLNDAVSFDSGPRASPPPESLTV